MVKTVWVAPLVLLAGAAIWAALVTDARNRDHAAELAAIINGEQTVEQLAERLDKLACDVDDIRAECRQIAAGADELQQDIATLGTELDQVRSLCQSTLTTAVDADLPVVFVYTASWCSPCQVLKADYTKKKFAGLDVRFVDEPDHPGWIRRLPTIEYTSKTGAKVIHLGYSGQSTIDLLKRNAR